MMKSDQVKIVQSFWSGGQHDVHFDFGWHSYKHHWLGWVLSAHLLAKNYAEVELYTDQFGYEVLINKLQLPYTRVHVVLDQLDHYDSDLWAMGKIKTYLLQDRPFLHIDADVFKWDVFPDAIHQAAIAVQNREVTTDYYRDMWEIIEPELAYLPQEMQPFVTHQSNVAFNMGIFGGNDLDFIHTYAQRSIEFVDQNRALWGNKGIENFNVFFEQVLLAGCAQKEEKKVSSLFDYDFGDNQYEGFGDFDYFPEEKSYLHLLGVYKRQVQICRKMEIFALKYFPQAFKTVGNLSPELGYYHQLELTATNKLVEQYEQSLRSSGSARDRQQIVARDLFMEGQVLHFYDLLDEGVDFSLRRLNEQKFIQREDGATHLIIYELDDEDTIIELTHVDEIIFNELGKQCSYKELITGVLSYLEDGFTPDQIEAFKITLIKRIECFISLRVITPVVNLQLESIA